MNPYALLNPAPSRKTVRLQERGNILFRLLAVYLFLLFFRPFDQWMWLQLLHLPMVTGGLCLVAYVARRLSRGQTVVPFSPIATPLGLLTFWMLCTIPFSFWMSGSLQTFWDAWVKMVILYILLANVPQSARQVWVAVWVCIVVLVCSLSALMGIGVRGFYRRAID